ncbi:unnamed protein product [Musa acuminata var. zebrina]
MVSNFVKWYTMIISFFCNFLEVDCYLGCGAGMILIQLCC